MYVDEIDDLDELEDYVDRLERKIRFALPGTPEREQAEWDLEDVYLRIQELDPEAGTE